MVKIVPHETEEETVTFFLNKGQMIPAAIRRIMEEHPEGYLLSGKEIRTHASGRKRVSKPLGQTITRGQTFAYPKDVFVYPVFAIDRHIRAGGKTPGTSQTIFYIDGKGAIKEKDEYKIFKVLFDVWISKTTFDQMSKKTPREVQGEVRVTNGVAEFENVLDNSPTHRDIVSPYNGVLRACSVYDVDTGKERKYARESDGKDFPKRITASNDRNPPAGSFKAFADYTVEKLVGVYKKE